MVKLFVHRPPSGRPETFGPLSLQPFWINRIFTLFVKFCIIIYIFSIHMSNVILSIDGTVVYNSSNSVDNLSNSVQKETYTRVQNPKINNDYYYVSDQDENYNPVYTKAKLIRIDNEKDGPMSTKKVYVFDNNVKKDEFQEIYSLKAGGKSRRRKLRKSKKRRTSRRIF